MLERAILGISNLNQLDNKTLGQRFIKYGEEFGEFSAEVCKLEGITHKPYDQDHLIEEAADTLQCLLSIMMHICDQEEISFMDIVDQILVKNQKWREKIPQYTINDKRADNRV